MEIEFRQKYVVDDIHEINRTLDLVKNITEPGIYYGAYKEVRAGCKCCYENRLELVTPEEYREELVRLVARIDDEFDEIAEVIGSN